MERLSDERLWQIVRKPKTLGDQIRSIVAASEIASMVKEILESRGHKVKEVGKPCTK